MEIQQFTSVILVIGMCLINIQLLLHAQIQLTGILILFFHYVFVSITNFACF